MEVKESDVFRTCWSLLPVSQSVQYTSSKFSTLRHCVVQDLFVLGVSKQ